MSDVLLRLTDSPSASLLPQASALHSIPPTADAARKLCKKTRSRSGTFHGWKVLFSNEGMKPILYRPVVLNEEGLWELGI